MYFMILEKLHINYYSYLNIIDSNDLENVIVIDNEHKFII